MLFNATELAELRGTFELALVHTYTRLPAVVDPTPDTEEEAIYGPRYEPGAPVTGLLCYYDARPRPELDPTEGHLVVAAPRFWVEHNSALRAGDQVRDIRLEDGTVLEAGPLSVRAVDIRADRITLWREVTLAGTEAIA